MEFFTFYISVHFTKLFSQSQRCNQTQAQAFVSHSQVAKYQHLKFNTSGLLVMLFYIQLYIQFIIFFMQNIKRLPFLVNQKKKKNWGLFKGLSKCCLYMYPDRKIVVAQIWPISGTFIWPAYLLQLTKCHHFMGKWAR